MQAHLTLDTTQFDQQVTSVEARLAALEARAQRLPGVATSNVGQDAGGSDPEAQKYQQRQVQRSTDVAAENNAHQIAKNHANEQAIATEDQYRRSKTAYQDYHRTVSEGLDQLHGKTRALHDEVQRVHATTGALAGPQGGGWGAPIGPTASGAFVQQLRDLGIQRPHIASGTTPEQISEIQAAMMPVLQRMAAQGYPLPGGVSLRTGKDFPGASASGSIAAYGHTSDTLYAFTDAPNWTKGTGEASVPGWFASNSLQGVVTHEFGHSLTQGQTPGKFASSDEERLAGGVSQYAMRTPGEFVAETFAGLQSGKTYSPEIMSMYTRYGGRAVAATGGAAAALGQQNAQKLPVAQQLGPNLQAGTLPSGITPEMKASWERLHPGVPMPGQVGGTTGAGAAPTLTDEEQKALILARQQAASATGGVTAEDLAYQQEIKQRSAAFQAANRATPGASNAAQMSDKELRDAATQANATRIAEMRMRRGLPAYIGDQVDENGNPLTTAEWLQVHPPGPQADIALQRHGRHPGTEGDSGEALQYQEYKVRGALPFALAQGSIGQLPGGGVAMQALLALGGPELAAVAAVTLATTALIAFGEQLKKATELAMAANQAQFDLQTQIKAFGGPNAIAGQGAGAAILTPAFQRQQQERMLGLGFGATTTTGLLGQLAPYVQTQGGTSRVMQDAADLARGAGIPIQQAVQLLIGASQGQTGALHQYVPTIFQGAPQEFALGQIEQRFRGTAQAYEGTGQGRIEKLQTDFEELMLRLGTHLEPIVTELVTGLDKLMPLMKQFVDWIGSMADAFNTLATAIANSPIGTLVAQMEGLHPTAVLPPQVGRPVGAGIGMVNVPEGYTSVLGGQTIPLPATQAAQSGGDLGGGLAANATAQITAIEQISQEVQNAETAITGMQKVFSELTTFHVDLSMVQANLNNLDAAIVMLEQFWIGVATQHKTEMDSGTTFYVNTWLQMADSLVTLTSGASDMFAKVYTNTGLMPSEAQMLQVTMRLEVMFEQADAIAQQLFLSADPSHLKVDASLVQGYADAMNSLVSFVSAGTDALGKIFSLPIPDPGRVTQTMTAITSMVTAISQDLVGAFFEQVDMSDSRPGRGRTGDVSQVINPLLSQSAAVVDGATKLMTFASQGIDALSKMRNIHIPSKGELSTIIGKVMDMTNEVAGAFEQRVQAGNVQQRVQLATGDAMAALGMPNIPKLLENLGMGPETDTLLNAAGKMADNYSKVATFIQAGVSALAQMRNLYPPSPGQIKNIINSVFVEANTAIAELPPYDPAVAEKVKNQGEAYGAILGAVSSGVSALAAMRDLAEPSQGQIGKAVSNIVSIAKEVANAFGQLDSGVTDKIGQAGAAYGAILGALSTGADVLQKIRDLPEPSKAQIGAFFKSFNIAVGDALAEAVQVSQATGDRAKDWGQDMALVFQGLSAGADWLAKIRDLYVPTPAEVEKFWVIEKDIADRFTKAAQSVGPELAHSVEDYGKAMEAAFGGLNAGADFMEKLTSVAPMGKEQIDKYFQMLGEVTVDFSAGMNKWVKDQDFENQQYSKELQGELEAMTAGTDFLFKLGSLKPDYTNAIRGYFAELNYAVTIFNQMMPEWAKNFNDNTVKFSGTVKAEMDAFNSALDPLTKIESAAQVRPEQIMLAFRNAKEALTTFSKDIINSPELQGDNLGKAVTFSRSITEIFGAMKTTVEAVDVLNQPGYESNAGTFGQVMNDFFLTAVPQYETQWVSSMGNMADAAEKFAGRSAAAIGSTPPAAYLSASSKQTVASSAQHMGGGGGTYTNCIIVDGDLIASDPDVAKLIMQLTNKQTVKNGGTPVGKNPSMP